MLWPDIIQFGRVTSGLVRGMGVTQSVRGWAHSYKTFIDELGPNWAADVA